MIPVEVDNKLLHKVVHRRPIIVIRLHIPKFRLIRSLFSGVYNFTQGNGKKDGYVAFFSLSPSPASLSLSHVI